MPPAGGVAESGEGSRQRRRAQEGEAMTTEVVRGIPPVAVSDPPVLPSSCGPVDHAVLDEIQRRVLWLATRIVDAANRERDTGDGVWVGSKPARWKKPIGRSRP